jgi:small-conductance mechanosensitive channel
MNDSEEARDRLLVAEATANEILARRNAVEAALMVRQAVERFNRQSSRQTRHLVILTWVIAALTLVMAFFAFIQWRAYRGSQQGLARRVAVPTLPPSPTTAPLRTALPPRP